MDSRSPPSTVKRRRWFQFRLRTLLLLPSLFAAAWLWVTWPERTATRFASALGDNRIADARKLWSGTDDGFETATTLGAIWARHSFTTRPRTWSDILAGRARFDAWQLPPYTELFVQRGKVLACHTHVPTGPDGWNEFFEAVAFLYMGGPRAKAADLFRVVLDRYPDAEYPDETMTLRRYSDEAEELATQLDRMAEEDRQWREPSDADQLDLQERIRYDIYHLRNINVYQFAQPGWCNVLDQSEFQPSAYNAAVDLLSIGKPAIPALVDILDDRRPIRSVCFYRYEWPSRTVLRYQDAAIQVLSQLLPAEFDRRGSTWWIISAEPPEQRAKFIARIRNWYKENPARQNGNQNEERRDTLR